MTVVLLTPPSGAGFCLVDNDFQRSVLNPRCAEILKPNCYEAVTCPAGPASVAHPENSPKTRPRARASAPLRTAQSTSPGPSPREPNPTASHRASPSTPWAFTPTQ